MQTVTPKSINRAGSPPSMFPEHYTFDNTCSETAPISQHYDHALQSLERRRRSSEAVGHNRRVNLESTSVSELAPFTVNAWHTQFPHATKDGIKLVTHSSDIFRNEPENEIQLERSTRDHELNVQASNNTRKVQPPVKMTTDIRTDIVVTMLTPRYSDIELCHPSPVRISPIIRMQSPEGLELIGSTCDFFNSDSAVGVPSKSSESFEVVLDARSVRSRKKSKARVIGTATLSNNKPLAADDTHIQSQIDHSSDLPKSTMEVKVIAQLLHAQSELAANNLEFGEYYAALALHIAADTRQSPEIIARCFYWRGIAELRQGKCADAVHSFRNALPCKGSSCKGDLVEEMLLQAKQGLVGSHLPSIDVSSYTLRDHSSSAQNSDIRNIPTSAQRLNSEIPLLDTVNQKPRISSSLASRRHRVAPATLRFATPARKHTTTHAKRYSLSALDELLDHSTSSNPRINPRETDEMSTTIDAAYITSTTTGEPSNHARQPHLPVIAISAPLPIDFRRHSSIPDLAHLSSDHDNTSDETTLSPTSSSSTAASTPVFTMRPTTSGFLSLRRRSKDIDIEAQHFPAVDAMNEAVGWGKRMSSVYVDDEEMQSPKEVKPLWQRLSALGQSLYGSSYGSEKV